MNIITLTVGDLSGDGHDRRETRSIETTFSVKKIEAAYAKGMKKLGFNPSKDLASKYEDNKVPSKYSKLLQKAGFPMGDDPDSDDWSLYTDDFVALFLWTVELGDPSFSYTETRSNELYIGGYGLFS